MNDEQERTRVTDGAVRRFEERDRKQTRRLLTIGVTRAVGVFVFLIVVYYLVPLRSPSTAGTIVRIFLAAVTIVLVVAWETRAVDRATFPLLRAVEALLVSVSVVVVAFAHTYLVLSANSPASFNEQLGRTSALYFTVTTLTTVGYGDIHAQTDHARIVVMVQMVANVILIGAVVRLIMARARAVGVSRTAK